MATLEYSMDLSRLAVMELDNNKKISEFNNISKNMEIRTPTSSIYIIRYIY
jgi:hypothetical protein